eukprot:CAMPEP_0173415366 /NCGR_PEP_ID=MMETSP1356-20130122/84818_1 /TAXON_ID=77927 ORGANISM="Hemiselmis virescens, Strain PCC157" /NCGR_SAMPLE_ID=MMETSP1356 /ASSEMBLY_ACC=CAM_ASM_000847 /LENGTH=322 /DNA_ID=CAMNT_0014377607 /DNA_START=38 /DNA_END=1006 /DNA_ORIENTATION=+
MSPAEADAKAIDDASKVDSTIKLEGESQEDIEKFIDAFGDEGDPSNFYDEGSIRYLLEDDPYDDSPSATVFETFQEKESHPVLSQQTRQMIWQLHTKDPVKHTFDQLSEQFRLSPVRIRAIVRMQSDLDAMVKRGMTPQEQMVYDWGEQVNRRYEEEHGAVNLGSESKAYAQDMTGWRGHLADVQEFHKLARPRPLYNIEPMEEARSLVKRIEKYRKKLEADNPKEREVKRLEKAAAAISEVKPMEQWSGIEPTASKRFKFVFADISKGVTGTDRSITVRDTDGTLRAADFEERFRVEKIVAPPVHPSRNPIKGKGWQMREP